GNPSVIPPVMVKLLNLSRDQTAIPSRFMAFRPRDGNITYGVSLFEKNGSTFVAMTYRLGMNPPYQRCVWLMQADGVVLLSVKGTEGESGKDEPCPGLGCTEWLEPSVKLWCDVIASPPK